MKVLLVNYEYPGVTENCGGGGEVTKQLKRGLEDRGHTVLVLTDNGVGVADVDIRGPETAGHYSTFPFRSKPLLGELVGWADVVHGHFSLPSSLLLPRYCEQHDTPLVVSVMGADIYDPTRFGWLRPLTKRLNRYILSRADRVVAPSHDMAKRTEAQTGIEPAVIHYGIDPDDWRWRRKDAPDTVRVLTVCRLVERKNLETAYQALTELRDRGHDVIWHVVGTGPLTDTVATWAGEQKWVWAHGYFDDLQRAFDTGDVFFLPSEHEAFGMVFLEAIACGLPVVTTDDGGQKDIMTAEGWLHGPGFLSGRPRIKSAVEALELVLEDYDYYQANTEGYVDEHFSQGAMVNKYEALYREVQ